MSTSPEPGECALCHQPIHSAAARARGIGSRCWRKPSPAQRQAIRRNPHTARAVLARPAPDVDGQLPLEEPTP
jgi:hypothetical protein